MKKKERPIHETSFETLISWGCLCGGRFYNEKLRTDEGRQKTTEELVAERDAAFDIHVAQMKKEGF